MHKYVMREGVLEKIKMKEGCLPPYSFKRNSPNIIPGLCTKLHICTCLIYHCRENTQARFRVTPACAT